jgi:hypothetical protein
MMGLLYEGEKTMADQFAPDRWWWEYHPDTKERIALTSKTGDVLLATGDERHSWLVVAEDKARLISAVPDLLAALIEVRDTVMDYDPALWLRVDAAITRATQPDA